MKLKPLVLMGCLGLFSNVFAANQHLHPQITQDETKQVSEKRLRWPGYCEIEIINLSYTDVHVTGVFDDGTYMQPFNVYAYEAPHYISLYYYGYCHSGMDLDIDSFSGYHLYGGYTRVQNSIRIVPYLKSQAKVQVQPKV
jgi:hypothetical protein